MSDPTADAVRGGGRFSGSRGLSEIEMYSASTPPCTVVCLRKMSHAACDSSFTMASWMAQ
jgi:hypothetical protein